MNKEEKKQFIVKMKAFRAHYRMSQRDMSIICGMGENAWYYYENGGPPQKSNRLLIEMCFRPEGFWKLLNNLNQREVDSMNRDMGDLFDQVNSERQNIQDYVRHYNRKLEREFIDGLVRKYEVE